jgi:hypothetical protein
LSPPFSRLDTQQWQYAADRLPHFDRITTFLGSTRELESLLEAGEP